MISITAATERQRTVLRIDGYLTAEDMPVLDEKCSGPGKPHVLDLSNLRTKRPRAPKSSVSLLPAE